MKNQIIKILSVMLALVLCTSSYYFFFLEGEEEIILKKEKNYRILLRAALKLQNRYLNGDQEGLIRRKILKCKKIPGDKYYSQSYSKCNPHYIDCFFRSRISGLKNKLIIQLEGKDYPVKARPIFEGGKYYRAVTSREFDSKRIPPRSIQVNLALENNNDASINVLLQDYCHMVHLPRKKYVYKEHSLKDSKEHIWDNFSTDIYVDQKLVSYGDIAQWIESGGDEAISLPRDPAQWPLPASNLSIDQMVKYCQFFGKKINNTFIYDAATFFPVNKEWTNYLDRHFPPYPWSKNKLNNHQEPNCYDMLSSDCSEKLKTLQPSPHQRTSWIGLKDILGGYPEYIKNNIHPQYNLKVSSFYLPHKSHWHQLGYRAFWQGKDFKSKDFTFSGEEVFTEINDKIKVGFRCVLEIMDEA